MYARIFIFGELEYEAIDYSLLFISSLNILSLSRIYIYTYDHSITPLLILFIHDDEQGNYFDFLFVFLF